jgi:hypothetical protein
MDESRVNLGAGAPGGAGGFSFEVGGYEITPRAYVEGSSGGSTPSVYLPEGKVVFSEEMTQASGKIGADIVSPGGDRFGGAASGVYARGSTKYPEQLQRYGAPAEVTYGTRGIQPTEYSGYYEPKGGPRFEGYYRPAMPGGRPDYGISARKVFRFEEGGAAPYEMDIPDPMAVSPGPSAELVMADVYKSRPEDQEEGIGSLLWDRLTGSYSTEGLRESGRSGGSRSEAIYGSGPTFMDQLITDYGYPSVYDPELGKNVIPTDRKRYTEAERYARPEGRYDFPSYPELEDARAHMLGSADVASKYGPRTAELAGDVAEFVDTFAPFPVGGSSLRDREMDTRNNAVGIQIFKKAGINADFGTLTRMVDREVFSQLDRIMGRSREEQMTPPSEMARAPRNFRSPEGGPDLYFPRNERGYFETMRPVLGFSRQRYPGD